MQIIIKNNQPAFHRIGLGADTDFIDIMPGINLVDDAKWARAATDSSIVWRVENDVYDVLGKVADGVYPWAKHRERDVVKLVDATVNTALLKQWVGQEKRTKVKAAIEAQLKRLELTPEEMSQDRHGNKLYRAELEESP